MDHVIMQANDGQQLRAVLECPEEYGVTRVVYPSREYRSVEAGVRRNARESVYETALLWPRGDDGGFAESFLEHRRNSRHTGDT